MYGNRKHTSPSEGEELLAGMLVLSYQSRLLKCNPVVWLCDEEPVRTF